MKNLSFLILILSIATLLVISCRQQDEILNEEDQANREILNRSSISNSAVGDSIQSSFDPENDGDPIPPPRK